MTINIKTYKDTDAYKYACDIVNGNIKAGKYIIKQCEIFLDDLERQFDDDFTWYFDLKVYEIIVGFQEFFKFADGINAGKTIKLAPFQEFIISNLFCWKHKEEHYVRYSKAYIQVARKNGKSFLLSFMALIKALLSDWGQIYAVATKRDQSAIIANEVRKLCDQSIPEIKDRFKIYGKAQINKIVCTLTNSEIVPLSSDANTLDGLI